MFKLEIIDLLNKIKNASDDYTANNFKNSLKRLIKQNIEEYKTFKNSGNIDSGMLRFLDICEKEIESEMMSNNVDNGSSNPISNSGQSSTPNIVQNYTPSSNSDSVVVKNFFDNWKNSFIQNGRVPNENCERIILELINYYVPNKLNIIQELLKVSDSQDFDSFKNMINNYIKDYFNKRISVYLDSEEYNGKWLLAKKNKNMQIMRLINDIGEYKFDLKKIEGILK